MPGDRRQNKQGENQRDDAETRRELDRRDKASRNATMENAMMRRRRRRWWYRVRSLQVGLTT